ncbi:pectate lyase-like adhesive domain-containing protein [Faecalispora jeddahensis]|uniref:pectate lyase-like adhesive domain-containing protein n=1 Tax=Faecalispora jeddahensis TaxID=1414721 RepID=UPI0028ABB47A|nr:pectate lyase-like adhesive domain-containing protein [Faecalispora jeddahensis]
MKKKLAKPLSLLLAAAMVVSVAQAGFPHVYAEETEPAVRAAEEWDGPAGEPGELTASEKQEFVFPFVTTGSAVLAELELDIYLNDDAKEIPDGKDDKDGLLGKDYEKAVKFNLPSFDKDQSFTETQIKELITHWLGKMKNDDSRANTITFLKAAGVTFSGDKGEEKVSSAAGADISYEGDKTNGTWSFTLDTTQLEKIEFLVEAHTDDEDISWGNNNYTLLDGTKAYLYTIEKGDTEEEVGNADDLKSALEDGNYDTIRLTDDIKIPAGENLVVANPVTIDGQSHKLSFTGLDNQQNDINDALVIAAEDVTVKDLAVDAGLGELKSKWKGVYAIQAYDTTGVTLEGVTVFGANRGIYVNSSEVALEGEIDVSGNGFGGIEVSNGQNVEDNPELTVNDGTTIVNNDEAYGKPTVLVDEITALGGENVASGCVKLPDDFAALSIIIPELPEQLHYYLDEAHMYDPKAVATVSTADELKNALKEDSIDFIRLTKDITDISGSITVKQEVVIDGDGHTLSFAGLKKSDTGADDALIIAADNSVVKNLTVNAGLQDPKTWSGIYAVHVYNAKDIILENVTAAGANGGILVNSSNVALEDNINVSGNGFGGIEVSKGAHPVGDPLLKAESAYFINESEKNGLPTIWVDGTNDIDAAAELVEVPDNTFTTVLFAEGNTKQVHYYLNEANTKAPQKVTDANELNAALINPEIAVIQLGNDISLSGGAYLDIARPVVLDGQNHALKFSGLEALDAADHNDDAVIIRAAAEGTKIQDLTVDAGLKTPKTWVGTYAIHAYNTREVTLYNVKATGANGGILVNSSDVTLKGEIDVSGNGFGGIEISKANESAKDSYLNAEEDTSFVNGTEAYGIPTLWVDGTADEEDAGKWLAVEENTFTAVSISSDSKQQVHYYLDPAHSEPIQSPKITIESIPEGIVATESKIAETETGKINVFSNNGRTPVQVSLTKGSENYSHVRVVVSLEKDGSRTTDGIQLIAQDTNHVWWNIVKSGWGPSAGFELPDKKTTTDVYLVAYQPGKYTANIQLIDVSNGNVLAEQSATITAASFHTVTLAGGGTDSSGGGSYAATTTVSINAGTRSGYSFNGWTASPAITFANAASAVTTFIMPDTNVTVTANWRSNSSSRDDDDSSSGGSSSKPSTGNQDTTGTVSTNPAPGGGTVTTVTTQPSSTVVTGGAAQITAAVPDSAAAAIASATPQSPAQVNISVPTAAVTQQLQNAEVTRASLTITVPPAVANNTNASAQVVVNADAGLLNAARVARKDLEITIQNAQTGRTVYAWSFNGAALAQATEIRSLNLALSVQPTSSVPAVQSAAPSSAGIVLRFANNGQLPAPATVTVDVSSQGYQPGQVLYFYYLNPNTGRLEAMNNTQPITVNAQGYAAVTVTHNSDFVLLPKKLATGSLTLDTVSYTLPKGKAYEIGAKLAGEGATLKVAPSRSGIVKIENTKSGNYKVTGLKDGITYVSFDVYSGGKLVSHSSVKITVQSSGKAQGVAGRRVMNF